jgi:dTDP-4-amino-4,6-dideoxygalactose transaminase
MSSDPIPLAIPNLAGNEGRYLAECVATNFVSSVGPFVGRFEQLVSERSRVQHGVAVSSGTCALHLALHAVGVGHGDLVVLPSFTFIASANAISHCGATPLLVDIDASWTIDPAALERVLAEEARLDGNKLIHRASGRRIAALLPVHTLGLPSDLAALGKVVARYGLPIVADAAAGLGATLDGKPPAKLAQLTAYSFNGNKTITTGGGGMIVGDDEALMRRVRHISSTARVGTDYHHDAIGFNYRMTNVQAAIGCAQMEQLDGFLAAKKRIRDAYDAALVGPGVAAFPRPAGREGTFWFSGVVVDKPVAPLCAALKERRIEARPFWKPIHLQPPYRDTPRVPTPVADALWARILTLPCSTSLSVADQQRVIDAVRELL